MASKFKVIEHTIPCQSIREYPRAMQEHASVSALRLAVKQYIPLDNTTPSPNDITIIAGHANGIPKECYEPLWEELLSSLTNVKIKAIWVADCAHQGASGILNEGILGDDPSWFDHSRDLLLMVNHFREQIQPPIVGVAHSFACAQFVHLSISHPSLFKTLIFLEPMIQREPPAPPGGRNPALWTSTRPDRWPSLQEAEAYIRRNPSWRRWDARCLERYITFGLRRSRQTETPRRDPPASPSTTTTPPGSGPVTLTTSKAQESWTFLRHNGAAPGSSEDNDDDDDDNYEADYRSAAPWPSIAFEYLAYLRPSVLYVFGSRSQINVPARREDKVRRTGGGIGGGRDGVADSGAESVSVMGEVVEGSSHMFPLEKMGETARVVASWVEGQIEGFSSDGSGWGVQDDGGVKSVRRGEGTVLGLSERWMKDVKQPLRGKSSSRSNSTEFTPADGWVIQS
ncbi:Alpha/beta hydrolase family-domain-containing protein [Aspergillus heterothallicus]